MSLKKIVFFAIIIASIFVINNLAHSIYNLWHKNDLIVSAKRDLEKEQKKNIELKKKLSNVSRPQFVEEEARNKLFLAKPGEGIIVLPSESTKTSVSATKKQDTRSNLQKWWDLFF